LDPVDPALSLALERQPKAVAEDSQRLKVPAVKVEVDLAVAAAAAGSAAAAAVVDSEAVAAVGLVMAAEAIEGPVKWREPSLETGAGNAKRFMGCFRLRSIIRL
jgi:hypothetical protein